MDMMWRITSEVIIMFVCFVKSSSFFWSTIPFFIKPLIWVSGEAAFTWFNNSILVVEERSLSETTLRVFIIFVFWFLVLCGRISHRNIITFSLNFSCNIFCFSFSISILLNLLITLFPRLYKTYCDTLCQLLVFSLFLSVLLISLFGLFLLHSPFCMRTLLWFHIDRNLFVKN